jgi:hypothetical protein
VIFKIVFRKTMVELKSCDMNKSVPNSSLTYDTRNVGEIVVVFEGFSIKISAMRLIDVGSFARDINKNIYSTSPIPDTTTKKAT